MHTDAGRNDNFVRARVNGANSACQCGNWNMLGNPMAYAYNQGYQAGRANGFQQGYRQANYDNGFNFGSFFARQFLGPFAWGC